MKKLVLAAVMVWAFASVASAAVREFNEVTVDVPDDWTVQEQGPMVLLIAPGQTSAVTVVVAPSQGMDAKQIAETGSRSVNGSSVKDEGNGVWSFTFEASGQKGTMLVSSAGDKGVVCTLVGDHPQLMEIGRSVRAR